MAIKGEHIHTIDITANYGPVTRGFANRMYPPLVAEDVERVLGATAEEAKTHVQNLEIIDEEGLREIDF